MPPSPDVVKTMPAHGPLQQYRLAAPVTFTCSRCGADKTSRLVTVVDGHDDRLLCNGCYGRLLSLWEVKAGDLPDEDRDDAILELLDREVTPEQVARAQARLAADAEHRQLSPAAQKMLATAEAVTTALRTTTGLDWSAAVIGLCKAVEVEVARRLAEPLRSATRGLDLTEDLADKDLRRLARYCAGQTPAPPELGTMAYVLGVAAGSRRRAGTSPLLQALAGLASGWKDGQWVVAADGLAPAARDLGTRYRNPAAHTAVLTEDDYAGCLRLVQGADGLLARLARATVPRA